VLCAKVVDLGVEHIILRELLILQFQIIHLILCVIKLLSQLGVFLQHLVHLLCQRRIFSLDTSQAHV
jgi:hypothetical protein